MQDSRLITSVALPAAGSTATTPVLDLGTLGQPIGPFRRDFTLLVAIPACPSLVDAKTITVTLKHSSLSGSGFVAIPGVSVPVMTGAGGVGAPALSVEVALPPHTLGYIEADVTVLTAGGDNTAKALSLSPQI